MGGLIFAAINKIISLLGSSISALLLLLPESPFTWDMTGVTSELLKLVLWIIPVASIVTLLQTYVAAVLLYYAIRTVLRWAKVAGD